MRIAVLRHIELKFWMRVGDGPTRLKCIFSKRPHQRSKVTQRSNYLGNILWPPNLVRKTPDKSVVQCWGRRSHRGHTGVKLLRIVLWQTNLIEKTLHWSVVHWWGQRSCRGQPGSIRGQLEIKLLSNVVRAPNLMGRNLDQIIHCKVQRPCRGQSGSGTDQINHECHMATKFWYDQLLTKV